VFQNIFVFCSRFRRGDFRYTATIDWVESHNRGTSRLQKARPRWVRAISRWGLTGTLMLEQGEAPAVAQLRKLASLLDCPLCEEDKLDLEDPMGRSYSTKTSSAADPRLLQVSAQYFLNAGVRQNYSRELDEIRTVSHEITVELGPLERLVYLDKANELGYNQGMLGLDEASSGPAPNRQGSPVSIEALARIRADLLMLCSHCSTDSKELMSPEMAAYATKLRREEQMDRAVARLTQLVMQAEAVRKVTCQAGDHHLTQQVFWETYGTAAVSSGPTPPSTRVFGWGFGPDSWSSKNMWSPITPWAHMQDIWCPPGDLLFGA
jgi:hypothetical protein